MAPNTTGRARPRIPCGYSLRRMDRGDLMAALLEGSTAPLWYKTARRPACPPTALGRPRAGDRYVCGPSATPALMSGGSLRRPVWRGASARSLFAEVLLIRGGSIGRHRPDLRRRRENGHTSRRRRMKLPQLPVLVFCARRALVSGGRLRYMIVRKPSISLPNRAPLRRGKLPPAPRFLSSAMFT